MDLGRLWWRSLGGGGRRRLCFEIVDDDLLTSLQLLVLVLLRFRLPFFHAVVFVVAVDPLGLILACCRSLVTGRERGFRFPDLYIDQT